MNCLQEHVPLVRDIIQTPTSVGGVPDRSVPHALALIRNAMNDGKERFVRADISGFFDGIPRHDVIKALGEHIADDRFLEVLEAATEVTLVHRLIRRAHEPRLLWQVYQSGKRQPLNHPTVSEH